MEKDLDGFCVGQILGPVLGIGFGPLLGDSIGWIIWNEGGFLEGFADRS